VLVAVHHGLGGYWLAGVHGNGMKSRKTEVDMVSGNAAIHSIFVHRGHGRRCSNCHGEREKERGLEELAVLRFSC
jgi:hypothetical protein